VTPSAPAGSGGLDLVLPAQAAEAARGNTQGLAGILHGRVHPGDALDALTLDPALEPEEVESLFKGGRPETKEKWAVVYGVLREMIGPAGDA
jgi:hypothetical protein